MRILVTGASGFIGRRICALGVERGHDIVGLMRPRGGSPEALPPGEPVFGQLPFDVPRQALENLDAVIHCAGATTGQDWAESTAITVTGTRFLLEGVRRWSPGLQRFVFLSSQSAHEGAVSAYGRTKLEAEALVHSSGMPYAIIRPGLVYGPGRIGLFYRMRQSVLRLPVLPLLGGGRAPVQPIEVDDLAEASFLCLDLPADESVELNLGEPEAMPLRDFLQAIAVASTGRRKKQVVIPLAPVKMVVGLAEALRVPLPVSSDNLRGLEMVRPMDTRPSLERLNLHLKPFDEAMRTAVRDELPPDALPNRPLRVLLIGAGKIGIVHALNLTRREGMALGGIVDTARGAFGLYKSMGFRAPFRTDAAAALEELQPDAAIVATPATTHLALARLCLERGVPALVEKPMAINVEGLQGFQTLAGEYPAVPCHIGYMAAQYPHLDEVARLLASGELGAVRGFRAVCLQSHIMAPEPVRWEMVRSRSGGGVIINFAGHVLAMLGRLFGAPVSGRARMWPIHSKEVEDAAEVVLDYGAFRGRMVASWSMPGYARPVYEISVETERARLDIDNYCVVLRRGGRVEGVWTQQDFAVGYNAAPDYTGGGFSCEHRNFARALLARRLGLPLPEDGTPSRRPVTIEEAAAVEQFIFHLYASCEADASSPIWPAPDRTSLVADVDARMDGMLRRLAP